MDLNMNLNITQEQKLVLTQQMKLSIDILQYSAIELKEFVSEKVQENPMLEVEAKDNKQLQEMLKSLKKDRFKERGENRINYDDEYVSPLAFVAKEENLYEYLMRQLRELNVSTEEKDIIEMLIQNIDKKGYLKIDDDYIKDIMKIDEDSLEGAIVILQGMEPVGIGARDLKECLLIQLERNWELPHILREVVNEHLELLALNKYKDIAKIYSITVKEAQSYGDIIKTLEPKPARGFNTGEKIVYVTPDAYIKKIGEEYLVQLNQWDIPKLNINDTYMSILEDKNAKPDEKDYVRNKITEAMNVIKGIDQRQGTLFKVSQEILKRQKEFFEKGDLFLKPMTLKDISESIGCHESTVSRAIKNKYLEGPRGLIAFKELFTVGLQSKVVQGESSSKTVKVVIKSIIDGEDKKKPLSDNKIASILGEEGIKISRRTVAKYREEMGILSTSKRKRF